jgi:hypothetical protein
MEPQMKPVINTVNQLLNTGAERYYSIPTYQRNYQWGEDRWHDLWHDLGPIYRGIEKKDHFVGAMIVSQDANFGAKVKVELIDGQQRLTTILILLAAIRDEQNERSGRPVDFNQDALVYVRDPDGVPTKQKVLEVSESDRVMFNNVLHGGWRTWFANAGRKKRNDPMTAYNYFRCCLWIGDGSFDQAEALKVSLPKRNADAGLSVEELWEQEALNHKMLPKGERIDLERLRSVVRQKLQILVIEIESHDESPVVVFDAINGKRTEFKQWDHSRTYLFMRLNGRAETVLKNQWTPIETILKPVVKKEDFDEFLYEYLIARGEFKNQGSLNKLRGYTHLRNRVRRLNAGAEPLPEWIETFIKDDFSPLAHCYPTAVSTISTQADIDNSKLQTCVSHKNLPVSCLHRISQIRAFTEGPATPLILHYLEAWHKEQIDDQQLDKALKIIESFLARALLGLTAMSPFRSKFIKLCGSLAENYDIDHLQQFLLVDSDYHTDEQLRESIISNQAPIYDEAGPRQVAAILRGIERQLGGAAAHLLPFGTRDNEFTVEHVYPQNNQGKPNPAWTKELVAWGKNSDDEIDRLVKSLHTLGNLTLIPKGVNSYLGSRSFAEKSAVYRHENFDVQLPNLNHLSSLQNKEQWTSLEIRERGIILLEAALLQWPSTLI